MLDDAEAAEQALAGEAGAAVVADDVPSLLGVGWKADLTSFQRRDIAHLLSMRHGANFSVPGAGKTRVGLAVYAAMRARGEARRLLVVSPKSAYESWLFESAACFEEPLAAEVMSKSPDLGTELLLVNYERLDRSLAQLAAWLRALRRW